MSSRSSFLYSFCGCHYLARNAQCMTLFYVMSDMGASREIRESAASVAAAVSILPRQTIARGDVADLRAQIALLALRGAPSAFLGHQFHENASDQGSDRSFQLGRVGTG